MTPHCLRALVILLASIALVPALGLLPNAARTKIEVAADHTDDWPSSLRLDSFGRDQDIVIPPVPPPPPVTEGPDFSGLPPTSFDIPVKRRTPIQDVGSLLDCDAMAAAADDIVIPPIPPRARRVWRQGRFRVTVSP